MYYTGATKHLPSCSERMHVDALVSSLLPGYIITWQHTFLKRLYQYVSVA